MQRLPHAFCIGNTTCNVQSMFGIESCNAKCTAQATSSPTAFRLLLTALLGTCLHKSQTQQYRLVAMMFPLTASMQVSALYYILLIVKHTNFLLIQFAAVTAFVINCVSCILIWLCCMLLCLLPLCSL